MPASCGSTSKVFPSPVTLIGCSEPRGELSLQRRSSLVAAHAADVDTRHGRPGREAVTRDEVADGIDRADHGREQADEQHRESKVVGAWQVIEVDRLTRPQPHRGDPCTRRRTQHRGDQEYGGRHEQERVPQRVARDHRLTRPHQPQHDTCGPPQHGREGRSTTKRSTEHDQGCCTQRRQGKAPRQRNRAEFPDGPRHPSSAEGSQRCRAGRSRRQPGSGVVAKRSCAPGDVSPSTVIAINPLVSPARRRGRLLARPAAHPRLP